MPVKRQYNSITGGTGDVNQQTYTISMPLIQTTSSNLQFPVPVPKFPSAGDAAVVMELLGVQWDFVEPPSPTAVAGDGLNIAVSLTTNPTHATSRSLLMTDPRSLSTVRRSWANTGVPATVTAWDLTEYDDLTDQAGHGVLVATDNVYLDAFNAATGYQYNANIVARLFYRMKQVKLVEYIGIVQSQQ